LGSPITLSIQPELTSHRGGLLSGQPLRGTPVYAASFICERRIVLEEKLLRQKRLFRLILVHELFHFVWARLGNEKRSAFSRLLAAERKARARGELGESAQVRKDLLNVADCWRDYVCESFCDTAAWFYARVRKHESFTLAKRWQVRRAAWFSSRLSDTLSS
jgi:hypothetical protein